VDILVSSRTRLSHEHDELHFPVMRPPVIMKFLPHPLLAIVLFVSCLLIGCASPAQPHAILSPNWPQALTVHEPVVVVVVGGEKTKRNGPSLISNDDFATAIIESLRKIGLFKSAERSGSAVFRLETTLEDLAQPVAAFSMTVKLEVDWRLIRISDNQVVWHDNIVSTYTATVGDAFVGIKRLRLATEGAARQNIEQGLAKLAAVSF
jgi:hypothetical protein